MHGVLYVDDERANLDLFVRQFDEQFPVVVAESADQAIALLEQGTKEIGLVVSDQRMPKRSGVELLAEVAARWPLVGRVLLTAYSDRELLLAAIRQGQVQDYLLKPWTFEELSLRLRQALDAFEQRQAQARAAAERDVLRHELDEHQAYGEIVGLNGGLRTLVPVLERVARTDSTVMIRGESGVGKELVARALHQRSARAQGPFVRINCTAFSEGVLESELFGHEAGAFTGAVRPRVGRFEQAHQGTLFLDEIGDVSPALQVKLLRVLQERELERVGGNRTIRIDIRVIAATHHNLEERVRRGEFREDLFYRLNVVPIRLPPLRERLEDVESLSRHFLSQLARQLGKRLELSPEGLGLLRRYDWPGNVRELRNVLERAAVLADDDAPLGPADLMFDFLGVEPKEAPSSSPATGSVFEEALRLETERVRQALLQAGGSRAAAARALGIPRTTLNDKIRRLGIR